ncbi:MAG TPA: hypothetical protein PLV92_06440, partial [Pirellulaceae bacterium]|nr:hypothetical protein [Pirellulaceae bacterium]
MLWNSYDVARTVASALRQRLATVALHALVVTAALAFSPGRVVADELPLAVDVEAQPLKAQVRRVVDALQFLGEPLAPDRRAALDKALAETKDEKAITLVQQALDPLCLAGVNINPESRVKVQRGPAAAKLNEQGWKVFLVKVQNEAGVTAKLQVKSPNAAPSYQRSSGSPDPKPSVRIEEVPDRWLDVATFDQQPLNTTLSGLGVEYRILQVYSRDKGKREGKFAFDVGQGTQDLGFRNEVSVLFDCAPAVKLELEVLDYDGKPTTGQFVFKDPLG